MTESATNFDTASAEDLATAFESVVTEILAASDTEEVAAELSLYAAGLAQFSQALQRAQREYDHSEHADADPEILTREEITELGVYGFGLLDGLRRSLSDTASDALAQQLDELQIPLALWILRHGGDWDEWESLTNALAEVANRVQESDRLRRLSEVMGELIEAAPATLRGDLERLDPSRPWRVLHLNRAIVAARSLDVGTMETAFDALLARLPEDAGAFFSEGVRRMEQMGAPAAVLDCFDRYQRCAPRPSSH